MKEDDVIAQIETDKVTIDVKYSGKQPGVIAKLLVSAQEVVKVGQPVAVVETGGAAAAAAPAAAPAAPAPKPAAEAPKPPPPKVRYPPVGGCGARTAEQRGCVGMHLNWVTSSQPSDCRCKFMWRRTHVAVHDVPAPPSPEPLGRSAAPSTRTLTWRWPASICTHLTSALRVAQPHAPLHQDTLVRHACRQRKSRRRQRPAPAD